jgi:subtilisin family serine protease
VVAAGNAWVDARQYPGALANTISVGAVNQDDNSRPEFSNFGEWVNASAPGVDVHSIFVEGHDEHDQYSGYARWSGTSFAAPTVAAAIATTLSPGGWRQFLWFLRPRTAFEAAFRLISDSTRSRAPGSGTIVRPPAYVS